MSRRITLFDFMGEDDKNINSLIYDESEENNSKKIQNMKKIMLKVINNELTERQKQIIMLYYFKNKNIVEISEMLNISHASVSVTMKRARNRLIKYMQYYL